MTEEAAGLSAIQREAGNGPAAVRTLSPLRKHLVHSLQLRQCLRAVALLEYLQRMRQQHLYCSLPSPWR